MHIHTSVYMYVCSSVCLFLGGALTARNELENQDTAWAFGAAAAATPAELQRTATADFVYSNAYVCDTCIYTRTYERGICGEPAVRQKNRWWAKQLQSQMLSFSLLPLCFQRARARANAQYLSSISCALFCTQTNCLLNIFPMLVSCEFKSAPLN